MKIKGFDKNLCCRGYQFEIGKEYKIETDKELRLCTDTVFHYCNSLRQVHSYYECGNPNNRFCEIEVLGKEVSDGKKCGSNHIKIVREIVGAELEALKGTACGNNDGLFNTGCNNAGSCNIGDNNKGYYNVGSCNVGEGNVGNYNNGNFNIGNNNIGSRNTNNKNRGSYNTGYYNNGDGNVGSHNIGDYNTGYSNFGNYNTGSYNAGDLNIGCWNKGDCNNGFFNTKEPTVYIFNKDSGMTWEEFIRSRYYAALVRTPFILTEWVGSAKESDGYLKSYTYEEACANWWKRLTKKDKQTIMEIPNFDKEIFKEITGIDVDKEERGE